MIILAADVCLQCETSRATIKRDDLICGIEGGYEYRELEFEWPHHRWADWTDTDLTQMGVKPESFEKYRRYPAQQFQYLPCDDSIRGHVLARGTDIEFGMKRGQCWACGRMPEKRETNA